MTFPKSWWRRRTIWFFRIWKLFQGDFFFRDWSWMVQSQTGLERRFSHQCSHVWLQYKHVERKSLLFRLQEGSFLEGSSNVGERKNEWRFIRLSMHWDSPINYENWSTTMKIVFLEHIFCLEKAFKKNVKERQRSIWSSRQPGTYAGESRSSLPSILKVAAGLIFRRRAYERLAYLCQDTGLLACQYHRQFLNN